MEKNLTERNDEDIKKMNIMMSDNLSRDIEVIDLYLFLNQNFAIFLLIEYLNYLRIKLLQCYR